MSEYDLVCDVCAVTMDPGDAVVTWVVDGRGEHDFTLAHIACAPPGATARQEVKLLVAPNTFLSFVTDRFGKANPDPEPLRTILWALAPFVMRHDNPAEMDALRAASFGAEPGVKFGAAAAAGAPAKKDEGGGK
ncbi:MAG TPA: hypothetical protein VGS17_14445 [Candidatus Limnocylindria bacterium]|nr:hypothetical protein [Candidatus Limnocylindria bacterium]